MRWNKKLLSDCKLYLILDTEVVAGRALVDLVRVAVRSGVDLLQLRDKKGTARSFMALAQKVQQAAQGKVPMIINDRVDIASSVNADGVHVGQDDIPVPLARKLLGVGALIGTSCQNDQHLSKASRERADYVGFGSVFKTLTKPQRKPMALSLLSRVAVKASFPVFAIGGITRSNLSLVRAQGITRVAVCREICLSPNPAAVIKDFKKLLRDGVS